MEAIRYIFNKGYSYGQLDGGSNQKKKVKFLAYDLDYTNILEELSNNKFTDGTAKTIGEGFYTIPGFVAAFNSLATNFEIVNAGNSYSLKCTTAGTITLNDNFGVMLGLDYNYSKAFILNEEVPIDINLDFAATHVSLNQILLPLQRGKKIYYFDVGIDFNIQDSIRFVVEYPLLARIRNIKAEKRSYLIMS